ncbi:MAG: tripartite tricarboxylate transporter substrate binding protein [Betaproteobacteria bacterium]|jgi:tripartite-type tricarboxylate transporter receptor subunit TctC|nr:tripartite tricarboxylate transporter substrate binding protein [Betaproteobacteria bacterium]
MNRRQLLAAAALAALAPLAHAQGAYPTKPIRLVVPFAPGGTSEIVSRAVAQQLSTQLGVSVVVENKAGGAGTIAMNEVAQAAPDGYTLILGHVGTLAVNPYAMAKQPYDVDRDFLPVALLARVPNVFVVRAEVPAKNLKEFVALAKKDPGKLNYGSAGNGSAGHLAFEYLKLVTGIDVVHVPYRGTGPQLQDLLGGRLDASSAGLPALMQHIKSGKLRTIAVGTPQRVAALPDVATVAEDGYKDFETSQWYGIIVPKGTPREIVVKLNAEINKALASSTVTQRFADDNAAAGVGSPEDFAAFIAKEQARWKEVVERGKIRIE